MSIIAIAGLTLLLIGMLTVMSLERKTARSYSNAARADLAVESGEQFAIEQITNFLKRSDVGGAAFTTWAYHPGGGTNLAFVHALTAGRPEFDDGTTNGAPYLNNANTIWLGTAGNDPDTLWADYQKASDQVVDLNADFSLGAVNGKCLARWVEYATDPAGNRMRYAVWVDDETSRLDVTRIGRKPRGAGVSPAEIPFYSIGELDEDAQTAQTTWRTGGSARSALGTAKFPGDHYGSYTSFSKGYDVIAYGPTFADTGKTTENGFQLPLRGTRKRNVNWEGHVATTQPSDLRVERLMEWMKNGASGFFEKRNLNFWPDVDGNRLPDYQKFSPVNPLAKNLREEQFRTIAASLIDYIDADVIPTQPPALAGKNFGNPPPGGSLVRIYVEVPRPDYFGADRTVRINEYQVIWNCRGETDNFKAQARVSRQDLGNGNYRYTIPITYRYELWNMDENPIPEQTYQVRTTYSQQIESGALGGKNAIPPYTEFVHTLNSGAPIAFQGNQIQVFDITETHTVVGNRERDTDWASFREFYWQTKPDGSRTPVTSKIPNGNQKQALVLLNAASGEWFDNTGYLQLSSSPSDGVCSVGPGNAGAKKGNRINDPRMSPLRMYDDLLPKHYLRADRDWAGNKPGTIGTPNNEITGDNYQNFHFWLDGPYFQNLQNPQQGVTNIANAPLQSIGELGRIFDPSWAHPAGRGGILTAHEEKVVSPFRGGGTLAIGQPAMALLSGSTFADHLDAKPWNLLDIFSVEGSGSSLTSDEFSDYEWQGRINVNSMKQLHLNATGSNFETLIQLPSLFNAGATRPQELDEQSIKDAVKARFTKGASPQSGAPITAWNEAQPFYGIGQLSELSAWNNEESYKPNEDRRAGDLKLLNRSDYSREEPASRVFNLITTASHTYRIVTLGQTVDPNGKIVGNSKKEKVCFLKCEWEATTGVLKSITTEVLYERNLN